MAETIIKSRFLCQLLMLTRQRIDVLVKEGWIKRREKGQYSLVEAVQGYIRFLRDDTRKHNISAADSRVRDARAKEIEARTAQRLGYLVPLVVFEDIIDSSAGLLRSEFAGLPARCTRDLVLRRIIEREVNASLHRIAEQDQLHARKLEAMAMGGLLADAPGGANDTVRADGAGPLGGGK